MGQETFKAFLKKMMSKSFFNSYISANTAAFSLLLGKKSVLNILTSREILG
jgi:hypothetical protein